jgi:hypothetical protein
MRTRTALSLPAGIVRRTLSEMPIGETWKPCSCKFVGSPRRLRSRISIVSPGLTRRVGPMKSLWYDFPRTWTPATVTERSSTVNVVLRRPWRERSTTGCSKARPR